VAFPYGRSALWTLLHALGLSNAEVIMPAYTCSTVAHAAVLSGNIPRFVDIDLADYNMGPEAVARSITERTRVIVATHLFGYPMNVDRLRDLVSEAEERWQHKIWIVQDCAHAFGARWHGARVCEAPDVALFGLNISKMITSVFGGMITTNDPEIHQRLRAARDERFTTGSHLSGVARALYLLAVRGSFTPSAYTAVHWLLHRTRLLDRLARSYHLDERIHFPPDYLRCMLPLEARVGLVQLRKYPEIVAHRRALAAYYDAHLRDVAGITLPPLVEGATYSHYSVRVPDPDAWVARAADAGVELGRVIDYVVPLWPAYRAYATDAFPRSIQAMREVINLPVHTGIGSSERERIVDVVRACAAAPDVSARGRSAVAAGRTGFERHWATNRVDRVSTAKTAEAAGFLQPLLRELDTLPAGARILDVGCGDGVHAGVLVSRNLGSRRYVGVDVSLTALAAARAHTPDSRVVLQAGDALRLPYKTGTFAAVFSYGVLAYTGAPEQALDEMVRVSAPGGLIGIWMYPRPRGLGGALFRIARGVSQTFGAIGARVMVSAIVPLLPVLPVRSGVNLFNSSWRQCTEVVEINLLPTVLDFYAAEEVGSWFRRRGLTIEYVDEERPIAIWARA
jgi:dTDP-4-amino-4,6-dideoxygalactose transaminase/SAM-dependent methyltransferase